MKIYKYLCAASLILIGIACSKSDFSSMLYEPSNRDVPKEIEIRYNLLVESEEGWFLAYKPSDKSDTVFMHLIFNEDGSYVYSVDRENYLEPTESTYIIQGTFDAELRFEEASIWGELKTQYHGATKFHILLLEDGVYLRRSDGFDGLRFELFPMGVEQKQHFDAKVQEEIDRIAYREYLKELSQESIRKLRELASLDDAYFNNILLGTVFQGMFDLDTLSQELSVYWLQGSGKKMVTSPYTITPWGMSFEQPLNLNGLIVDSLTFGDFAGSTLNLTENGSIPVGRLAQEHSPSFIYPTANEYVFRIQESSFKARWQFVTADGEENIGPGLLEYHQAITDIGLTFGGYNLYVNNAATGHNRYGFTVTMNGSAHYLWHQDIIEEDDGSLIISQSSTVPENSLGNGNFNNLTTERKEILRKFYRTLFEGGIYVWPNGRASNGNQSIRLINKQDSKIYLTLKWIPQASNPDINGFID